MKALQYNEVLKSNYFELFDLPINFDIDSNLLHSNYQLLQKIYHPDNFKDNNTSFSTQLSSHINHAFNTLNSPLKRAQYLLSLNGLSVNLLSQDLDSEFLMNQMNIHEEIEEATREEDVTQIENIKLNLQKQIEQLISEISKTFKINDLESIQKLIRKLSFISKMKERLDEIYYNLL